MVLDISCFYTYRAAYLRCSKCTPIMQEELNAFIEEAVFNSKALASTKADSKGRQGDVYNSVRKEIEYVSGLLSLALS